MATFKIICFKRSMANMNLLKETTLKVEKKPLVPVLLYLDSISLQNGT